MKTAVDRVNKGKGHIVNASFAVMCEHYLFDADFCNVTFGWRRRTRRFNTLIELNAWLCERCQLLWRELLHPDYMEISVADMLKQE